MMPLWCGMLASTSYCCTSYGQLSIMDATHISQLMTRSQTFRLPIQSLSEDGSSALASDFQRLEVAMPGALTGFADECASTHCC